MARTLEETKPNVAGDKFLEVGGRPGGGGSQQGSAPQFQMPLLVEEPGVYAFRLVWSEGTGGANLELDIADKDGTTVKS